MKLISRNEYFKKIQNCSKKEMRGYDIVPLDLSSFRLSETTQKIANANFMEETTNRNGDYMLRGHWLSDLCYAFASKCNFHLVQPNAYMAYAYSDEQMAIFTFCEGDITLTPYTSNEKYQVDKAETIRFYKES